MRTITRTPPPRPAHAARFGLADQPAEPAADRRTTRTFSRRADGAATIAYQADNATEHVDDQVDIVDTWGRDSFPASDAPANW